METRHDFRLRFTGSLGRNITFTVPRADSSVDNDQLTQAMQSIILSQAIRTAAGTPMGIYSGDLITTERTTFTLN